jgi:hypothetical protein
VCEEIGEYGKPTFAEQHFDWGTSDALDGFLRHSEYTVQSDPDGRWPMAYDLWPLASGRSPLEAAGMGGVTIWKLSNDLILVS